MENTVKNSINTAIQWNSSVRAGKRKTETAAYTEPMITTIIAEISRVGSTVSDTKANFSKERLCKEL